MHSPIGLATRRSAARSLALGSCALVLGVAAAPAEAAVAPCKAHQLVVWLDTQPNGAAGTIFYTLNFTNVGAKCSVRGYPGVSAFDRAGKRLGAAAVRNPVKPVKTITLDAPSALHGTVSTAHALVGIVETGVFSHSVCAPTIASGLRIFAPNQSAAALVPFPLDACARSGPKFLNVSAVTK